MFASSTYQTRRAQLFRALSEEKGIVLFLGNNESPMNYAENPFHFRQDSNFLYFFGIDRPHLAAILDLDEGSVMLFGDDFSLDHLVWMGEQPSLAELAAAAGVSKVLPMSSLQASIWQATVRSRHIHFTPPYRHDNILTISQLLDLPTQHLTKQSSIALIRAIVSQRSRKSDEEVQEMELALDITYDMHLAAMQQAREGVAEKTLVGSVHSKSIARGGGLAYPAILTVNGQILHNHAHANKLKNGQMVLCDFGAETARHYAGDITRTFPVKSRFLPPQKEIYQIVLSAQLHAISALCPGVSYLDIHLQAAQVIAEGLKSVGILKGDMGQAVAEGAHALFFPHGLGHLIGLDVHDMEDLGEDLVGYDETVVRSQQFGLRSLRLAKKLEKGFVVTVEPGIYFIPQLIERWESEGRCKDFINYSALEAYKNFGGIRIEDNCLLTENGCSILGTPIPKTTTEIEVIRANSII